MATLILTTVGTAIGGPIGGMIGAALGGAVDREVFAGKPRQGPRLADLKLQTSIYGSAIPRVYGRARVAGTVIWASGLSETKQTSGGKGQPKTTSYSYSASFAVALSSRLAPRVGRIWADGKLLRGSAGDFKTQTGFRWIAGSEDQPVDALIASAVGIAHCPAYRGLALAVFENMAVADYGNRIPSLTFELIADEGAIDAGEVVADLCPAPFSATSAIRLVGYAAEGASIADALVPLVELGGLERTGAATAPVLARPDEAAAVALVPALPPRVERVAQDRLPGAVALRHYDPARDYQAGSQTVTLPLGGGAAGRDTLRIDLPAVLSADVARAAAGRISRAHRAGAIRLSLRTGMAALALRPGAALSVAGLAGRWTLADSEIDTAGVMLTLAPQAGAERIEAASGADPGVPVIERDWPVPPTHWRFIDLPPTVLPHGTEAIHIAAAGTAPGWRGAEISVEGGWSDASVGRIAVESVMGSAVTALPPGSAALFDRESSFEVELLHDAMELAGADDRALLAGRNLALVGDELIQFGAAEALTPTRWRLSALLRGRAGSEAGIALHAAGDDFTLIAPGAQAALETVRLGGGAVSVAGIGDDEPAIRPLPIAPRGANPLSPVHLSLVVSGDGSVELRWIRRSRAGFAWRDGVDAPIAEDRELYRATIGAEDALLAETSARVLTVSAATLGAHGPGPVALRVRQVGTFGLSEAASATVGG